MTPRLITAAFLFFLFSNSIFSQEWAPIGAKWYYTYHPEPIFQQDDWVETIEVVGDTTFLGKQCRVLKANYALICAGSEFMYSENDSVFYYDKLNDRFNLLYVFNPIIGQSWNVPLCENQDGGHDSLALTIKDKYISTFGTVDVVTYDVEWSNYFGWTPYDGVMYEYIGSAASMHIVEAAAFVSVHSGIRGLRCYDSPSTGLINFLGEPCDQIVSAKEELKENSFLEIYPSPVGDLLKYKINSARSGKNAIRTFNFIGDVFYEKENIATNLEQYISVTDWPTSIYLMQYLNSEQIIETKRFVVAR